MSSNLKPYAFGKQRTCPSSERLLAYSQGTLSILSCQQIRSHLANCDFCGAELQLLSKHPPVDEHCVLAEMPLIVRLLAEKLLPNNLSVKRAERQSAA